ncbi:MAG: hypothetical protein EHM13_14395 [Acidobacteria bacterium]|nr:MAG: hypothetical protein EHM13_14395 [Acidobacteriota bacterium]
MLRSRDAVTAGGETLPPGAFIVPARRTPRTLVETLARDLSVPVASVATVAANVSALRQPRIGLYQSWVSSMDEGWIRWIFDQFDFKFAEVHDPEVRAGALEENYDVFVIPSMAVSAIVDGHKPGTMPPQYVGGIGEGGVQNIRRFVENGGTLVLVNNASQFAIDKLKAPVIDALKDFQAPGRQEGTEAKAVEFACPGSVLRMSFDVKHPVAYGMPEEAPAMFVRSPAFNVSAAFTNEKPVTVIARYPGANLLMSGFLKGEQHLHNRASAVEVPLGKGRMILLGFGVQQRGQPYGTFKLLFNALYYSTLAQPGATPVRTTTETSAPAAGRSR